MRDHVERDPQYARNAPLNEGLIRASVAHGKKYYPSEYAMTSTREDAIKDYREGVDIVKGAANAADNAWAHVDHVKRMGPHAPPPAPEQIYEFIDNGYRENILMPHMALTDYDTYRNYGTCKLTNDAYGQCVTWKTAGRNRPVEQPYTEAPNYRGEQGGNLYWDKVPVVDERTGHVLMQDRLIENTNQVEPSWSKKGVYETPDDLYRGHTILPVDITNPVGMTRTGTKLVQDLKGSEKEVTVIDDYTGQKGVTLTLKDSEHIVHIQELDEVNLKNKQKGMDGIVDKQLVTVCDEVTDVCNLFEIDLLPNDGDMTGMATPVDTFYAPEDYEEVQETITKAEMLMPMEPQSDPVLVDPLAVGADENDVCWLEDILVDVEYNGEPVVETEIFCVDGDTGMIYSEPVDSVLDEMDSFIAPDMGDYEEPVLPEEGFLQAPIMLETTKPSKTAQRKPEAGAKRRNGARKGARKGRKPKETTGD